MNDDQLVEKRVLNEEFMTQLRVVVENFLSLDDFQEAYNFVSTFENLLTDDLLTGPPEYLEEMKKDIIQAKWVALPLLKEPEILEMFRSYLLVQYGLPGDLEYDLWGKMRTYLITLKVFQDRDDMRKKIRTALLENREIITSHGSLSDGGKALDTTIGNWLGDYNKEMGVGLIDALKINTYLNKHSVTDKLTSEEVERLRRLFNFFEIMKISSLEPEGYEENFTFYDEKLGPGIVRAGKFEPTDKIELQEMGDFIKKMKELKIPPFDKDTAGLQASGGVTNMANQIKNTAPSSLDKVFGNFLNTKFVADALNGKSKMAGNDLKALRNDFYQAVNAGNKEEAVAALILMAEIGKLSEAFGGDERFVKFWSDYLVKNNPVGVGEFQKDPANAKDLARFLQYILEGRLKMKSDEAAMVGVLMSNAARAAGDLDYETLAYGDMGSGEFRWNA